MGIALLNRIFRWRGGWVCLFCNLWVSLLAPPVLAAELPEPVVIKALDTAPLGGRIPLLLIHGMGSSGKYYGWEPFLVWNRQDPSFEKQFKIYLCHYNPKAALTETSRALVNRLNRLITEIALPRTLQLRVVGHSQGGLLYQYAAQDPVIAANTGRLIAIATPFHGTPLANAAWVKHSLGKHPGKVLLRLATSPFYATMRKRFPAYETDFSWDNFDGAIPQGIAGVRQNPRLLPLTRHPLSEKTIAYGGYFETTKTAQAFLLDTLNVAKPTTGPAENSGWGKNVFSKHARLRLGKNTMAALSFPDLTFTQKNLSMLAFNDGVSPISSTLWLGRNIIRETVNAPITPFPLWPLLAELKTPCAARLFSEMDHRDFLVDRRSITHLASSSTFLKRVDLLHSEEPPRTLFEWVLHDLKAPLDGPFVPSRSRI